MKDSEITAAQQRAFQEVNDKWDVESFKLIVQGDVLVLQCILADDSIVWIDPDGQQEHGNE